MAAECLSQTNPEWASLTSNTTPAGISGMGCIVTLVLWAIFLVEQSEKAHTTCQGFNFEHRFSLCFPSYFPCP